MSEPAGTLKVRIEPDLEGFKEKAAQQAAAANLDEAINVNLVDESKVRATQTALKALQKELTTAQTMQQSAIKAGGPLLEAFSKSIYAQDLPALEAKEQALQRQLVLEREIAAVSRARVREQVRAQLAPPPTAPPAGGGIGGTIRQVTAGRSAGIGGLIGMTARLGLVGFAANTAFQAVGELQNALRVTGDDAFTTEGKMRNLGAELIGGNLIGGIKALFATKQARLLGDLPAQIQALKDKLDPLAITEEKLIEVRARGADATRLYVAQLAIAGRISDQTAKDLLKVSESLWEQEKATKASGDAILDFAQKLEKSGKDQLRRGSGSGFMFQQTGLPPGQAFGSPQAAREAGAANLAVMNTIRASITSRIKNDRERATQELEDARIIQAQAVAAARQAFGTAQYGAAKAAQVQAETTVLEKEQALLRLAEQQRSLSQQRNNSIAQAEAGLIQNNAKRAAAELEIARTIRDQAKKTLDGAKGVQEINAAWFAYRLAVIGVASATQASKEAVDQAARDAQALGDSVRESIASRIPAEGAQQQALLRAARIEEKNARAAFEAKRHTDLANDRWNDFVAAKTKTILIEQGIAETGKAAAEKAADEAKNAQQQALQNAITIAQQSGSVPALKAAYQKAIAYWQAIADGNKATSAAHQDAVAQVLSLTAAMKTAIGATGVREAKLQNDAALAELKGLDTRPFLLAMVRFAKEAMDNAKAGTLAFENARGAWIAARANLAGTNDTLNELKRANARARAALTEGEADDERLLRAEIRRLDKKVKATKGMGVVHQRAIAELLQAESELKGMVDEIKPTTTVFDLLTASTRAFTEHAGNVINASNRFDADSFTGGLRGQIGTSPNAAGRARLGLDDDRITTSLDKNTEATNRLTLAFGGRWAAFDPVVPAGGKKPAASGGTGHWGGWQESFAAARARGGIN